MHIRSRFRNRALRRRIRTLATIKVRRADKDAEVTVSVGLE
jgi:hypothetical protein